ncbi:large subunit ribosomal protein L37 [Cryptococcus neoformans]|nr:large subunit ribosomal protein L37 [Cryptococcus neoformans var. grubii Bt1]OXC70462.1 hypothetical protein AYX13_00937 [Cryptococcus neoformans var. grubii]OXG16386.1 large subunit ribosomal protein L37 [Cryptococcus neoformans var. grubii Ze90-1]OXH24873.1 large subunit ribosomal protein L37 [Cryptococcus neoformans var. grubii]OXM76985.1 large subunit ribosomal protein L37 [Cryptococcus neoformans var. grubii Bt63]
MISLRPLTSITSRRSIQVARAGAASFSSSSACASPKTKPGRAVVSSCPAGTPLANLSVLKDKPDPVALPDDQYPAWLWTLLEDTSKAHKAEENAVHLTQEGESGFDLQAEKKKLKNLNRQNIKGANYLKSTA